MNNASQNASQALVLVGAGHANVALIRRFAMEPLVGTRLVVVNPYSVTPYSGMLPGFLSGQYREDELFIDIGRLCKQAGARLIRGSLEHVDTDLRRLTIRHQVRFHQAELQIDFDTCVLNTGAIPGHDFPTTHPHYYPVKPIRELLIALPQIDQQMSRDGASMVVVGGGAAGIELAFAFRTRFGSAACVTLISKRPFEADAALSAAAKAIRRVLVDRGITCIESQAVVEATEDSVVLSDGRSVAADVICAATPVHPPDWILDSALPTEQGFLAVNDFLQVQNQSSLFAAGDIVSLASPRGRSGVMAVRAGQYLADAIWKRLQGTMPHRFKPQQRWLTLLNLGNGSAIAAKGRFALESPYLLRLKDRIDRQFMQRFQGRSMRSEDGMRCEGCAAKLSGQTLQAVFPGVFEDAAIEDLTDRMRVRSIDALTYLVDDPYVMGVLSVRHAMSDIWAMGARPTQCLSLIGVQRANSEQLQADEFAQCFNGVKDAAKRYEVSLSGGHSLALEQPVVAISIEGETERLIPKQGARPGDEVWLTGPIGSGVLFAAEAAGEPVGQAIDRWLPQALESLFAASEAASALGVHAMTVVTGFGLAGHLKEMLDGSGCYLCWADSIPMFEGVSIALARGIRSSAHHENQIYAGRFGDRAPSPVVFDPQTCGPLMVAVCPTQASTLIKQWTELGFSPQRIGSITTETS